MLQQQKIKKALADLETAGKMRAKADAIDYRARKQLESICSSAGSTLDNKMPAVVMRRRMQAYSSK